MAGQFDEQRPSMQYLHQNILAKSIKISLKATLFILNKITNMVKTHILMLIPFFFFLLVVYIAISNQVWITKL